MVKIHLKKTRQSPYETVKTCVDLQVIHASGSNVTEVSNMKWLGRLSGSAGTSPAGPQLHTPLPATIFGDSPRTGSLMSAWEVRCAGAGFAVVQPEVALCRNKPNTKLFPATFILIASPSQVYFVWHSIPWRFLVCCCLLCSLQLLVLIWDCNFASCSLRLQK